MAMHMNGWSAEINMRDGLSDKRMEDIAADMTRMVKKALDGGAEEIVIEWRNYLHMKDNPDGMKGVFRMRAVRGVEEFK